MAPKGATREALMRKLGSLMPKRSLPELMAHDDWHTAHKMLQVGRVGARAAGVRKCAPHVRVGGRGSRGDIVGRDMQYLRACSQRWWRDMVELWATLAHSARCCCNPGSACALLA